MEAEGKQLWPYVDVVERVRVSATPVVVVIVIVAVEIDIRIRFHDINYVVLDSSGDLRSRGSSGQSDEGGEAGGVLNESLLEESDNVQPTDACDCSPLEESGRLEDCLDWRVNVMRRYRILQSSQDVIYPMDQPSSMENRD